MAGPEPLTRAEFGRLLDRFGGFEPAPRVAVAVSGGADSMALALMANAWARDRGGEAIGLTVDHALRPESADEARRVQGWLAAAGMGHRILRWRHGSIGAARQARAREARYRLLEDWCRENGVLHLLLAHHREDQAETVLMRLAAGSGPDGLAGMAPVLERDCVRLLRPVLDIPRARLAATLLSLRQDWLEDPSNRDAAFLRTRLRAAADVLAGLGLTAERLARVAAEMGEARAALDTAAAALLARAAAPHPAGFVRLDAERISAAPAELARRAVRQALVCVGGGAYPPREERLRRLLDALRAPPRLAAGRTLAGCRVLPTSRGLLVCREPAAARQELVLKPGERALWDGRFVVALAGDADAGGDFVIRRLGGDGWRQAVADQPELRACAIPAPARPALPALWRDGRLLVVPHLGYRAGGEGGDATLWLSARLRPRHPLAGPEFGTLPSSPLFGRTRKLCR